MSIPKIDGVLIVSFSRSLVLNGPWGPSAFAVLKPCLAVRTAAVAYVFIHSEAN